MSDQSNQKDNSKSKSASLLGAVTIISGTLYAELKLLAVGLNGFSDSPAGNPISPRLLRMQRAAAFCGFWGVSNYLDALSELATGIEVNPPLSVNRTEYLERIKTLAAGINALGVHLRAINTGSALSYTALNEQFAKVIRKARPSLLEITPEAAAPMMFMPVPPSLEVDAYWEQDPLASHDALLQSLSECILFGEITNTNLKLIAKNNSYRSLSGLFDAASCLDDKVLHDKLSTELRLELVRLQKILVEGVPSLPPSGTAFLFSKLLFILSTNGNDDELSRSIRKRYALVKPSSRGNNVISMHDVAIKFSAGMNKLKDAYSQSALSNTPYAIKKLAENVFTESEKLGSPAFVEFASALRNTTKQWDSIGDPSFKDWTYGAAIVLMLHESSENWADLEIQAEMMDLANRMAATGQIQNCKSLQRSTQVVAIKKACAEILVLCNEVTRSIDGSLRSLGDDPITSHVSSSVIDVLGPKIAKLLDTSAGFCSCLGLSSGVAFSKSLNEFLQKPETWMIHSNRNKIFDGLSRLSLFIGRLRPGSLIDLQDDETGDFINLWPNSESKHDLALLSLESAMDQGESKVEPVAHPVTEFTVQPRRDPVVNSTVESMEYLTVEPITEPVPEPAGELIIDNYSDITFITIDNNVITDEIIKKSTDVTQSIGEPPLDVSVQVNTIDDTSFFDEFEESGRSSSKTIRDDVDPDLLLTVFLNSSQDCVNKFDTDDTELCKVVLEEAEQCISDIERCLAMWSRDCDPSALFGTTVEISRYVHTLKGAARTCGLMGIGAILHAIEDDLELNPDDGVSLKAPLKAYIGAMTVVRDHFDAVRSEFENNSNSHVKIQDDISIPDGGILPKEGTKEFGPLVTNFISTTEFSETKPQLSSLTVPFDAAKSDTIAGTNDADVLDAQEVEISVRSIVADEASNSADFVESTLSSVYSEVDDDSTAVIDYKTDLATLAALDSKEIKSNLLSVGTAPRTAVSVRVPLNLASKVGDASGKVMMASRRSLEIVDRTMRNLREVEDNIKRVGPVLRELDIMAGTNVPLSFRRGATQGDSLELDRYTSLQEMVRRLKETYEDSTDSIKLLSDGIHSIHDAEQERVQLSDDLQRESSELLLVGVSAQKNRLERVVAKACEDTGKSAKLVIDPRCRVPAAALDKLMPVFEHLLRNSIAHGIESPLQRVKSGKPAIGVINIGLPLSINQDGSVIKVSIRDDGAGIDHANVLAVAKKRGLAMQGKTYSDIAIREFLFMSGFTTLSSVSQVAGRGVGLDVVSSTLAALGGMVSLDSKLGEGTEFTLTLSTDISSMSVVLVSANGYKCLIPLSLVTRIVPVSSSLEVEIDAKNSSVSIGTINYELIDLATRVPFVEKPGTTKRGHGHLILMKESDVTKAVLVDSIGTQSRMVTRHLGPFVRNIPGMVAGTTLTNGEAGLVVNPLRLQEIVTPTKNHEGKVTEKAKIIMVVDDSNTVRMVTTRFLRRLGFDVSTAKDGLEALQLLTKGIEPDGFLLDIEMPGMDGYELMAEIRRIVRYETTPIIIISSRTAEKHRDHAKQLGASAYLTKPYEDSHLNEVLESLIGLPS